jgi:hypothetical protein
MADGFDDAFVATRRQLRGVAESLIAGPQYRASGTIRLAVRPDGFTRGQRSGPFWNAPFGVIYQLEPAHDVDSPNSSTSTPCRCCGLRVDTCPAMRSPKR